MTLAASDVVGILDAILEGFQIIGPDWRYLHLNETAARHGRSQRQALLGRTMMECYPGIENTDVFVLLRRCMEQRESRVTETRFTFPDGSVGWFEVRIHPVPAGICVLSIDVTARKEAELARAQAEERLQHAQRMDSVGQLAAGLAHDFNSLLSVILGQGEVALLRPGGPARGDIEAMTAAARSAAAFTRQLLDYGRRTVGAREVIDLCDVVRGLEPILRRSLASRIDLQLRPGADALRVEADRSQIEQIVMNLVFNARDAIPATGTITVALTSTDLDGEAGPHPDARPGRHAVIVVTDTGVGMDAATKARIFEPFFTTKERGRGTGLGLATVYGIVRQHGGAVWVYSEPGKGSTFKVWLPLTNRQPVAMAAPAPARLVAPPPAGDGPTVLVAEDEPLLAAMVEVVLSRAGYRVLVAEGGAAALLLWEAHRDAIVLLVTDVTMPGLSGPELVDRLRGERPGLPVICTSGYTDSHLKQRGAIPAGVVFMEKPFAMSALVAHVRALLEPENAGRPA